MNKLIQLIKHTPKGEEILTTIQYDGKDVEKAARVISAKRGINTARLHSDEEWEWLDYEDRDKLVRKSNDGLDLPEYMQMCYTYKLLNANLISLTDADAFMESTHTQEEEKVGNDERGLLHFATKMMHKNIALS